MAGNPYRAPAPGTPESGPLPAWPDIAAVAVLAWVVTLVRVVAALVRAEAPSRELDLAWLVLFFAPVVIWKELQSRRAPP